MYLNRQIEESCIYPLGLPNQRLRFVLAGDSRIRQIYKAIIRFLQSGKSPQNYKDQAIQHHDLKWNQGRYSIEFKWTPLPTNMINRVGERSYYKFH